MRTRIAILLATLLALVVACGAPKSGGFSAIDDGKIPTALSATTTTSTTTTTTIPETTTTLAEEAVTTTTTAPVPTTIASQLVRLYFVAGRDKIVSIDRPLAINAPIPLVLTALESAPTDVAATGLRTALPEGETPNGTDNHRGLVKVDISSTFLSKAGEDDQRLAVAQIVLTLTHLSGISQVTFTSNGEPIQVNLADGTLSDVGAILFGADFEQLLDSAPPTSTSTSTTTTTILETTTTAPPDPVGDTTLDQTSTLPSG